METIRVETPNGAIEMAPVDRAQWPDLRRILVQLQSMWIEAAFATGQVVADPKGWQLMKQAIGLHSRVDSPGVAIDLDTISNDYAQIERLFFADTTSITPEELHRWNVMQFDLDKFVGCDLCRVNRFNPRSVIAEADQQRSDSKQKAKAKGEGDSIDAEPER